MLTQDFGPNCSKRCATVNWLLTRVRERAPGGGRDGAGGSKIVKASQREPRAPQKIVEFRLAPYKGWGIVSRGQDQK